MKNFLKENYLFLFALAICVLALYFYAFSFKSDKVCLNGNCFFVEKAVSDAQREKGLMFRDFLPVNKGMLFVFDKEDYYSMWMKNMKIPLDIIFVDKDLKIIYIARNVQPCLNGYCPSIGASEKSMYVLEINAGLAEKEKIEKGQKVEF